MVCALVFVPLSPLLDAVKSNATVTLPFLREIHAFPENDSELLKYERENPLPQTMPDIVLEEDAGYTTEQVVLATWLVVALLLFIVRLWKSMNMKLRHSDSEPVAKGDPLFVAFKELSDKLGIKTPPWLVYNSAVKGAMASGMIRPVVLLPETFSSLSTEQQKMILIHELAHIRRMDIFVRFCLELVAILFWFHPLFWLALRQYDKQAEVACDDAVLKAGYSASRYCEVLLRQGRGGDGDSAPALLKCRMESLLNKGKERNGLTAAALLKFGALFMLAVLPLGLITFSPYKEGVGIKMVEPTEGLKALWRMDLGRGDIAVDSSGGGFHGKIFGAKWVNDPERGNCLSLDGVDDFVAFRAPDAEWTTKDFTFCAWLKPAVGGDGGGLLLRGEYNQIWSKGLGSEKSGALNYAEREITLTGDSVAPNKFYVSNPGLHPSVHYFAIGATRASTALPENKWSHLAVVWRMGGHGAELEIYINGEKVQMTRAGGFKVNEFQDWPTKTWLFGVGESPSVRGNSYEGCASDVVIYQKALSKDEVKRVSQGDFTFSSGK